MKKFLCLLFLAYLITIFSCSVFAVNENSEDYSVGYEDGWIDGYNEAESEYEDNYDNGYWDGYADAEKELKEQQEESSDSDKKDNLSKNLMELFSDKNFMFKIISMLAGMLILILNQILLYYDKIGQKLYTVIFIVGIIISSFNFIFD